MKTLFTRTGLVGTLFLLPLLTLAQSTTYRLDYSTRNYQLGHYYKMVSWDDSQYKEATYYLTNSSGDVIEFMNWRIIFPAGYSQTGATKYPMILMLHGAGESGREWTGRYTYTPSDPEYDNNGHNLLWGGREHRDAVNRPTTDSRSFPGIVVFPQVNYNGAWSGAWDSGNLSANNRMAVTVVEYLIKNYNVDQNRIAVHGLSAGAKGVWDIVAKRPDLFASMLPMSGVGSDMNAMTDILVTTPIWLFQGGQDTNPSPSYSKQWIDALKAKGGDPRYTVYPNLGHGVWNTAYAEPDFFSWIKSKDKRNIYVFGGATALDVNPNIKLGFSAGFTNYQWLKDGEAILLANSRYFTTSQPGVYSVRFTRRIDGATAESFPVTITTTGPPPPPPPPPVVQNGLLYKYYENYQIDFLSSFDFSHQPTVTGEVNNFTNSVRRQGESYVLSFDGQIQIDNTGTYVFYTNSDEGSQLFINGNLIVNNDGRHTERIASGSFNFSASGKYPIRVTYFQAKGKQKLDVRYSQGLINNYYLASNIPNNKLFLPASAASSSGRLATKAVEQQPVTSTFESPSTSSPYPELGPVLVYPNPFQNELRVQFRDEEMSTQLITMCDLVSGEELMRMNVEPYNAEAVLDFAGIRPGQYVLTVGNRKFRVIKRD